MLIKNLLTHFYVKMSETRLQRNRNTLRSKPDVIFVYPQYYLTVLNALYLCNDQELSHKNFYTLVLRHCLQDCAIKNDILEADKIYSNTYALDLKNSTNSKSYNERLALSTVCILLKSPYLLKPLLVTKLTELEVCFITTTMTSF